MLSLWPNGSRDPSFFPDHFNLRQAARCHVCVCVDGGQGVKGESLSGGCFGWCGAIAISPLHSGSRSPPTGLCVTSVPANQVTAPEATNATQTSTFPNEARRKGVSVELTRVLPWPETPICRVWQGVWQAVRLPRIKQTRTSFLCHFFSNEPSLLINDGVPSQHL